MGLLLVSELVPDIACARSEQQYPGSMSQLPGNKERENDISHLYRRGFGPPLRQDISNPIYSMDGSQSELSLFGGGSKVISLPESYGSGVRFSGPSEISSLAGIVRPGAGMAQAKESELDFGLFGVNMSNVMQNLHHHMIAPNSEGKTRTCVYCKIKGNKTDCGWHIKSRYHCKICEVPLCSGKRDCYNKFHQLMQTVLMPNLIWDFDTKSSYDLSNFPNLTD